MSFIISLIKRSDLALIRKKLITIYILNVTDIIFTIFLLNTGMFMEVNSIMAPLVNNRKLFSIIIKLVIPFVLLLVVSKRMKDATEKQLHQANIMINGCLILYVLINISHIIWCVLFVFTNAKII
ncbi:hypothetical protein KPL37_11855 [Clostridium frigoris]|uniref:DUF5658 domain-containing protein n=1 Tax=Clostridium frigoris TaxID=205327 RepID=A0ABS6BWK7_9CLOT|nr:DUF5658 family protein [Clostridium frigoris]MBU3160438.1 hypothetical protein [Clostridium frigoris]